MSEAHPKHSAASPRGNLTEAKLAMAKAVGMALADQ